MSNEQLTSADRYFTDEEDRRYSGDRLVFFSDAVIAIAMTLLALELPVPRGRTNAEVWRSFVDLLPAEYLNFVISFAVIAVFWIAHHQFFRKIHAVSGGLRWLNIGWLFLVVLVPFATRVNSAGDDLVLGPTLYAIVICLLAVLLMLMAWHAGRAGLLRPDTPPHAMRQLLVGAGAAALVFLVSIPVSVASPSWGRTVWVLTILARLLARRLVRRRG
ncbi:TMEM175 family protein [Actinophytocola sp.]|uniref:TMEM175 family protein n=1 Tax=Actinophytocola sp. TaxID=1872138 RepID=UPI00389A6C76